MAQFYDAILLVDRPMHGVGYSASVPFHLTIADYSRYTVTKTILDDNGFETLRLLREQFGRTKRQTMISTLMRIVLQQFDETKLSEQLTKWEFTENERMALESTQVVEDYVVDHEDKRSYLSLFVHAARRFGYISSS